MAESPEFDNPLDALAWASARRADRAPDVVPPSPQHTEIGPVITDGTLTSYEIVHDPDGIPTGITENIERLGFRTETDNP